MNIDHLAIYVSDLKAAKLFFETYFSARANDGYHNETTGLKTYFLSFGNGCRLEIMQRPEVAAYGGAFHFAFSAGSRQAVDVLTKRLGMDGYDVLSGPRITGDGYYESLVLGPDGIHIEIVE